MAHRVLNLEVLRTDPNSQSLNRYAYVLERATLIPPLRTKSVGTKVSEEEFSALEAKARARKLTLSEWVRAELLEPRGEGQAAANEVLLGEVLALRTILMTRWKR